MSWNSFMVWGIGLGTGWLAATILRPKQAAAPPSLPPNGQDSTQQLQQAQIGQQMADQLSRFKSGFLARTSHELRSPLNSVISLHQLILSDLCDSPEEERLFVSQAHDAATRMLKLLDELIHVSKLEYGSIPLQLQPVCLAELLQEVWRLTHLQAQNRNLRLDISEPDPTLHVFADFRCLRQVLVSLITAPIALMQEGTIRLSTQVSPDTQQVQLLISDERPSVSPSPLSSDPPDQALSPAPPYASAELSLMLSQTLMQLMRGRLEVLPASQPAERTIGSDFTPTAVRTATAVIESVPTTQICCWLPLAEADLEAAQPLS